MILNIVMTILRELLKPQLASLGGGLIESQMKSSSSLAYVMVLRSMRLILITFLIGLTLLALAVVLFFGLLVSAMNLLEVSEQTRNIIVFAFSAFGLVAFSILLWQVFSERRWVKAFKLEAMLGSK